jgi:hypothetical protein
MQGKVGDFGADGNGRFGSIVLKKSVLEAGLIWLAR